jgi:hypothetical protein
LEVASSRRWGELGSRLHKLAPTAPTTFEGRIADAERSAELDNAREGQEAALRDPTSGGRGIF